MPFEGVISGIAQKITDEVLLFLLVALLVLGGGAVYLVAAGLPDSFQGSATEASSSEDEVPPDDARSTTFWNDTSTPLLILVVGMIVVCGLGVKYRLNVLARVPSREHAAGAREVERRRPLRSEADLPPWLAVLDLENQSGRPEDEPFSFGVSSLLRRVLERLPRNRFGVVPRSQLMGIETGQTLKSRIREITGAHFILEGALDRRVDPWIISLKLSQEVDPASESWEPVWEDRFRAPRDEVQEEGKKIAEKVVAEFLSALDGEKRQTDDVAAYRKVIRDFPTQPKDVFEAFIRGDFAQNRFNNLRQDHDYRDAEYQLNKALRSDPEFRDARAKLAFLYIQKWETDSDPTLLKASEREWKKILGLAPRDPFALVELAYVSYVQESLDGVEAVELARRAVDADPEHAYANNVLALLYLYLGYYEANVTIERTEVFKRAPAYVYPRTNAALALQLQGDHAGAIEMADAALKIEQGAFVAKLLLGAQHYYLGNLGEAKKAWSDGRRFCPEPVASIFDVALGWIQAKEGDRASAKQTVQDNNEAAWLSGPYGPYFSSLCALTGEADRAIDLLGKDTTFARSYRYLIREPTLRPLAQHERFRHLLERRYAEWRKSLEALGQGLPNRPDRLPTPEEFLARTSA